MIIFGTRRHESVVDRVLEYCPVHRELHDFDLVAVRVKGHLYGVSFGKGRLAGHELQTDLPCGHARAADPIEIASAPAELRHATQLANDRRLREQAHLLSPAERANAIRAGLVQACAATTLDPPDRTVTAELKGSLLKCGGATIAILVLALALESEPLATAFFLAFFATIAYVVIASNRVKKRLRGEALATAAQFALQPLQPTAAELSAAAAWADAQGYREVSKLDLGRLAVPPVRATTNPIA